MLGTRRTKTNRPRTRLLPAVMTILLAVTVSVFAQEMKVPETAKDHHEMAEHYQKVAAQTRDDIEMHKKMLADFIKTVAKNPKSGENPYAKQMRLHCEKYIKAAAALAAEADESAKFHTLRAKELEGN
jgi:hypothetical protein